MGTWRRPKPGEIWGYSDGGIYKNFGHNTAGDVRVVKVERGRVYYHTAVYIPYDDWTHKLWFKTLYRRRCKSSDADAWVRELVRLFNKEARETYSHI